MIIIFWLQIIAIKKREVENIRKLDWTSPLIYNLKFLDFLLVIWLAYLSIESPND